MARLAFAGSPPAAVPTLVALAGAGHEVALVVSRPDTRRGRGGALMPSAVKAAAAELGLPVTDRLDDVLDTGAELGIVVAYGRIVPARLLEVLPMLNVHFSLLPRWRGAAPVERAILAGDTETGVCVMRMEAGLDTGPVLAKRVVPIGEDETAPALTARLAEVGAQLLVETLAGGVAALGEGDAQEGEPTYAAKIEAAELAVDWSRPAIEVHRLVRLGRAWTTWRGTRLGVLAAGRDGVAEGPPGTLGPGGSVATGDGAVLLEEVKPEGRRAMAAGDWLRGVRPEPGEVLGGAPAVGSGTP